MTDPSQDPELRGLVSAALELQDSGVQPPLEEICKSRPDLIPEVERAVEASKRWPVLQRESVTYDPWVEALLEGRYRLEHRMGSGAMGVVYRGEDLELKRPVAVKILRAAFLNGDEAEARFHREAEALAAIAHPSVVTVYDRGRTTEGDPYLVMELLEGIALDHLLDEAQQRSIRADDQGSAWLEELLGAGALHDPSYVRNVLRWMADLANGLNAAHERGILHRDVKPSNIIVQHDGRPALLDFGIAAQQDQATLTQEGSLIGTPAYLAPEALEEKREPSEALDVYGLAATLYHLLTFQPPYRGTPSQVLAALATKEVVPAQRIREIPRDLQAILDKGMARAPKDRYPTAGEFEEDLRAFLDHRPVKARPLTELRRVARRVRRSRVLWTLVAVGLVVLAWRSIADFREARLLARDDALAELRPHFLPNRFVLYPHNRRLTAEEGPEANEALLDRAVAVANDPIPTVLRRAFFRLDHGDPAGAAEDMRRIADHYPSAYLRGLAAAYERLEDSADSSGDLGLDGLPNPETPQDHIVAATEALRAEDYGTAKTLLEDERLQEDVVAQELYSLFLRRPDPNVLLERALWIEEQLGQRTATTRFRLSLALMDLGQYQESYEAALEGIALAPTSYSLHHNAAFCLSRTNQLERALAHLDTALALKPTYVKSIERKVWVLTDLGRHGEAQAFLDAVELDPEARSKMQVVVHAAVAEAHLRDGESELARSAAEAGLARFEGLGDVSRSEIESTARYCAGVVEGEPDVAFGARVDQLAKSALNGRRLQLVLEWWPEDFQAEHAVQLHAYLTNLQDELTRQQARFLPSPDPLTH